MELTNPEDSEQIANPSHGASIMENEAEARADRIRTFFNKEYLPGAVNTPPAAEHRVANALEYIAYQAGEMRKDISAMREMMEKIATK